MISIMRALPLRLTHLLRLAAVAVMAARLVIAAAPYADAARGASAAAHVESSGTSLHFAHDDADCVLCAAHQLVGTHDAPIAALEVRWLPQDVARFAAATPRSPPRGAANPSRAPPLG